MENEVKHWCVSTDRYSIAVIENNELNSVPVIEIECEAFADHWQTQRIGQYCFNDLKRSVKKVNKYMNRRRIGKEKLVPTSPIQDLVLWEETPEFTYTLQRTKSKSGKVHYSYTFYDSERREIPVIRLVNVEIGNFVDHIEHAMKCVDELAPESDVPNWLRPSTANLVAK